MGDAGAAVRFLAALPFETWAMRMRTGSAEIHGNLAATDATVGGHPLTLWGPTRIDLLFLGGAHPELAAVDVACTIEHGTRTFHRLRVVQGEVTLDEAPLPRQDAPLRSSDLVTALLRRLSDVSLLVRARPEPGAIVRLPEGIEVALKDAEEVMVRARAVGPPEALVLASPMELKFGDRGIRLDHRSARWLARLAKVRIRGARLHPDGRVVLDGGAAGGFDGLVRGSLKTASVHLSTLVRRSPRFKRVRDFLRR